MKSLKKISFIALALASGIASAASQPFTATSASVTVDQAYITSLGYTASALGSATYNSTTGVLTDPVASMSIATSPGPLLVTFATGAGIRLAQSFIVGVNLTNFTFNLADNTLYGDVTALGLTNQALLTAGTIASTFTTGSTVASGSGVTASSTTGTLGLLASNFRLADDFIVKAGGADKAASFQFIATLVKEVKIGTVASVPEPSTYALMGLGLVGISLVARRRRAAND
jgi:hypothetical protein